VSPVVGTETTMKMECAILVARTATCVAELQLPVQVVQILRFCKDLTVN